MRIAIREQLGLLVLLTSLIALAVVAIATVSMLLVLGLHMLYKMLIDLIVGE